MNKQKKLSHIVDFIVLPSYIQGVLNLYIVEVYYEIISYDYIMQIVL